MRMRSEIISLPFYDIRWMKKMVIRMAKRPYSVAAILIHSWRAGINKNLRHTQMEHAASIIRREWRSAISL